MLPQWSGLIIFIIGLYLLSSAEMVDRPIVVVIVTGFSTLFLSLSGVPRAQGCPQALSRTFTLSCRQPKLTLGRVPVRLRLLRVFCLLPPSTMQHSRYRT